MGLLSLLPGLPWRWIVPAAIAAAAYFIGYLHGSNSVQADWDAETVKQRLAVAEDSLKRSNISTTIGEDYNKEARVIYQRGQELIKYIPYFIPNDDTDPKSACTFPVGFGVYHDAAASNTLPLPNTYSGVDAPHTTSQEVAATVSDN